MRSVSQEHDWEHLSVFLLLLTFFSVHQIFPYVLLAEASWRHFPSGYPTLSPTFSFPRTQPISPLSWQSCRDNSTFLRSNDSTAPTRRDSAGYHFPPVTVEATPFLLPALPPQYTISSSTIAVFAPPRLHAALNTAPGIFIRDYGGFGGLKTISLRGSGAAQTTIYLEGFPLNALQNGVFDLGSIPAQFFDKITLYKSASLPEDVGANIGGAVHLFLPRHLSPTAIIEIGSFGYRQFTLASSLSSHTVILANYLHSRGNYPFHFNNFGTPYVLQRTNGDLSSWNVLLTVRQGKPHLGWKQLVAFAHSNRGVPGPVVQGKVEARAARLQQTDFWTATSIMLSSSRLFFESQLFFRSLLTTFRDPEMTLFGTTGLRARYLETHALLLTRLQWQMRKSIKLLSSFAFSTAQLYGPMLQALSGTRVAEQQFQATIGGQWQHSGFAMTGSAKFIAHPSAAIFLPMLSFQTTFAGWHCTFQISRNYRFPTFNERYYLNYGNADLRPEHSWNLDLTIALQQRSFQLSTAFFGSRVTDLILSVPKSPVEWQAQNIGTVLRYGIEIALQWQGEHLFQQLSATVQRSQNFTEGSPHYGKDLSYTPRWLLRYHFLLTFTPWKFGGILEGTGGRYALLSNLPSSFLPSYWVFTLFTDYALSSLPLTLRFECRNCTDTHYEVIWHYPMPGRWFRLVLKTQLPP